MRLDSHFADRQLVRNLLVQEAGTASPFAAALMTLFNTVGIELAKRPTAGR